MTTLYNIGEDLAKIAEQIQELLDEGAEPNSNQVQELLLEMVGADDEWKAKATRVGFYIKNTLADANAIDAEIKRLSAKKAKLIKSTKYLEDTLIAQMTRFDIQEIPNPTLTLKLKRNPPSVVVIDEDKIPEQFKRIKYEVDKTAIKKAGGVDGAEITNTFGLKYV